MTNIGTLYEWLRRRFFSPERQDELVYQWTTLRQTGTLAEYREKFFLLQTSLPLGERAEYLLASLGLQPELRAEVQQEVDDNQVGHLTAERMFEVARRAKLKSRKKVIYPTPKLLPIVHPSKTGEREKEEKGISVPCKNGKPFANGKNKDKHKGETDKAAIIRLNPCWVCDKPEHLCYVRNSYMLIRNLYVVDPPYILPLEGVYFSIQSSILAYIYISIRL